MPTVTGSWAGSGGARGRLICEYSTSNVSDTVTRVSGSVKAEADNSVYDSDNTLTRSGVVTGAGGATVGGGTTVVNQSVTMPVPAEAFRDVTALLQFAYDFALHSANS